MALLQVVLLHQAVGDEVRITQPVLPLSVMKGRQPLVEKTGGYSVLVDLFDRWREPRCMSDDCGSKACA